MGKTKFKFLLSPEAFRDCCSVDVRPPYHEPSLLTAGPWESNMYAKDMLMDERALKVRRSSAVYIYDLLHAQQVKRQHRMCACLQSLLLL